MLLLGLDFETTWEEPVDPHNARIIEMGAVLYDTDRRAPVDMLSKLISVPKEWIKKELQELTGITPKDIDKFGKELKPSLESLDNMVYASDYVVAHNGNAFDKIIYEKEMERIGVKPLKKPSWIDTKVDVKYPESIKTRKLSYLAAEHGFANPFSHRALFDVLTMLKVLEMYDIDEVVERSKEPTFLVTAAVSFNEKEKAKQRGYFWNSEDKKWQKEMKESDAIKEEKEAPFKIFSKEIEK